MRRTLLCLIGITLPCLAGTIHVPGGAITIPGLSSSGTSFVLNGTITQNDTIDLTISGSVCLQASGTAYCTNGAGVVTVAGSSGVGTSTASSFPVGGYSNAYTFGTLVMVISGVGAVQLLSPSAATGVGSNNPPTSVSLATTSLSALGFGSFSATNPTISFIVADNNYPDNGGSFTLTQSTTTTTPATVPVAGPLGLLTLSAALLAMGSRMLRRQAS